MCTYDLKNIKACVNKPSAVLVAKYFAFSNKRLPFCLPMPRPVYYWYTISVLEGQEISIFPKIFLFKPLVLSHLEKVSLIPSLCRTSLFLLLWHGEPPPRGEGGVGDALRHYRVLHLWPGARHLRPRHALSAPTGDGAAYWRARALHRGRQWEGDEKAGEGRSEVLLVTLGSQSCTANICCFPSSADTDLLPCSDLSTE